MANFFKEYQAEIRRKREQERQAEQGQSNKERAQRAYIDGLERGDKFRFSTLVYAGTNTPANVQTLYFAAHISDDHILASDNKRDAMNGRGYIYPAHGVIVK